MEGSGSDLWRLMRCAWVKNIAVPVSDTKLKVKGQMVSMAIGAWPAPLVLSKLPVQMLIKGGENYPSMLLCHLSMSQAHTKP